MCDFFFHFIDIEQVCEAEARWSAASPALVLSQPVGASIRAMRETLSDLVPPKRQGPPVASPASYLHRPSEQSLYPAAPHRYRLSTAMVAWATATPGAAQTARAYS